MTANPFAAMLAGVPRLWLQFGPMGEVESVSNEVLPAHSEWLRLSEVLAALAAAVPADLAEAGKVADDLRDFTEDDAYAEPWAFGETCKAGADTITALLARIAAQEATIKGLGAENKNRIGDLMKLSQQMDEWKASQHYRYIGADGQHVLARDLEARAEAAETALAAERAKMAKLVEKAVLWIEQGMVIVAPDCVPQRPALDSYRKQFASLVRAAITEAGHE